MNTQLTDDRISTVSTHIADVRLKRPRPPSLRPTPLERLALRVGIALIIWGRRGKRQPGRSELTHRSELTRRHEAQAARERRERSYQQDWMLVGPRR